MKKLLIAFVALLAVLAIGLAAAWWWLTDTRSGAQWGLERATPYLDELTWEGLEGGLSSGLQLTGLVVAQAGTRVEVDEVDLTVRVRPFSGLLIEVRQLHVRGARIDLPEGEDPPPDAAPFDPATLALPVAIDIHDLRLEAIALHPADGEPIVIDHLALVGHYADHLRIDRLELAAPQGQIEGSGRLALTAPFNTRLTLATRLVIDDQTEQTLDLDISGPLASLEVHLAGQGPASVEGRARVRGLPELPSGSVRLSGRLADWPGLDLIVDDIDLDAEGGIDDWSLALGAQVEGMDLPPSRWQLEASGDLARVHLKSLRGELLDGEVHASGELEHGGERLRAEIELALQSLDFSPLYPDWPHQARVNGELVARLDGDEIHLDRIDLTAPPTELALTGSGRFVPAADELALELNWSDLAWPPLLDEGEPWFASQSGRLQLDGRISDWRLELEALLSSPDLPAGELGLRADGSDRHADIEQLNLDLGQAGRLAAAGRVGWDPMIDSRLEVEITALDPSVFVAELPGHIDARTTITLRQHPGRELDLDLDLAALDGQLRDQPLTGSGRVRISDEAPEATRLNLALGDNRIELGSEDGRQWQWRIDANALDQLWPDLSGQARLEGDAAPYEGRARGQGELRSVGIGDIAIERVDFDSRVDWGEQPRIDLALHLVDVDLNPWERLDQVELAITGGCDDHQLELNVAGQRGTLDLLGRGRLDGCLQATQGWQGELARLYLGETIAGDWQLDHGLPIRIDRQHTEAGPGCLRSVGNGEGRVCLQQLSMDETGRARIGIERLPMDLLLLAIDPVFSLTTPLSGELEATWSEAGLTGMAGHLQLDAGSLRAIGDDDDLLAIDRVRVDFTPEADHGLLVDLVARLEGDSELTSQAHVRDLRNPAETRINADARLALPDIGAFNHLVAELDQLGGRLDGQLNLAGSLTAPSLTGRLGLSEGYLVHAPLGLRVSDISIDLEGETDRATLVGRASSGDGQLALDGSLRQQADGWHMALVIDGERFALAGVDWLDLRVSPDIRLEGNADRLDIDGDIHINRMRAGLPPGAGERVTPSGDVVVLGETEEDDDELPVRRLHGRLGIHMGNDSRLSAVGLQARLGGGLELTWNGSPEPRGRGAILIPEGSYRAYGQNLAIRDGEILFTGHPLDNPRLDIRAVRDIFGDPRVEAAGVHIRGPAQKPRIDLFTDPPTTDEKALAYVVTGADFDHAAGQAAVNVGFYLIPRLFVSYGIGLFEAGNVLSGRYELSERWGVRVVSGERDTGVDLGFITDR